MSHRIVAVTVSVLAACSGGGAGGEAVAGFERSGRCTMTRVNATDAARSALESATRAKLGPIVTGMMLTPAGDRVFNLRLSGAPAPASAPETEAEAEDAAKRALERYGSVFGAFGDQLPPPNLRAVRTTFGPPGWQVEGSLSGGNPQDHVRVTLDASGAPTFLIVKAWPTVPSPEALCADPRMDLDDPAIRRTVTSATAKDHPPTQGPREIAFTDADIVDIRWNAIQIQPDHYRRVIDVDLKERMWTAHLDADTGALLGIQPNFVY